MRRLMIMAAVTVTLLAAGCSGGTTDGGTRGADPATTAPSVATIPGSTSAAPTGTSRPPAPPVAPYASEVYSDPAHWLCRPGLARNVCDDDLTSTAVAADGTLTTHPFTKAADPGIDCFYVYPTISADPGMSADLDAGPDSTEADAVRNQAARLGSVCRVFAPVYRQVTLGALFGRAEGDRAAAQALAYGDALDAWRYYLANDNDGRGVILVGHSQGSGHLAKIIKDEIDGHADVRSRLVAAYLIGSGISVPEGADVGGDFQNVPLCRRNDQIGCLVAFSSFRSTAPPVEGSFFGKPRSGGGMVACVNPAALAGGSAELHNEFVHKNPVLTDPAADAKITTPYVSLPGLVTGECVNENGYSYLKVTVHGDPADPRTDDIGGDLTPQWGLHLVDVNLVMDDLVTLAGSQAEAYLRGG